MRSAREAVYEDCRRSLETTGVRGLEPLRDSQIVITGATGFVGTWLLTAIAYLNDVHGLGIAATALSRRPSRLAENAPFLVGRGDIVQVQADVRQLVDLPPATRWIVHAAAVPDSRHHATNPIDTASVIAEGTARVMRMAEQAEELERLLHFSSGLVHARGASGGADGDGSRVGASSVYSESKTFSEALCAAYRSQARLPIVITRPFTFLGPFQPLDAPWAANNFLHSALAGLPLKLLGSGEASRSYLYGSDMAFAALHQLVQGKSGETFDLGGTEPVRLIELARMVVEQAGRPLEIRVNTAGKDAGSYSLIPDMSRSTERFGFTPAFSPAEAVSRTLEWHRAATGRRRSA
jgi:dTDP-glucose 4,6-dehydratase